MFFILILKTAIWRVPEPFTESTTLLVLYHALDYTTVGLSIVTFPFMDAFNREFFTKSMKFYYFLAHTLFGFYLFILSFFDANIYSDKIMKLSDDIVFSGLTFMRFLILLFLASAIKSIFDVCLTPTHMYIPRLPMQYFYD